MLISHAFSYSHTWLLLYILILPMLELYSYCSTLSLSLFIISPPSNSTNCYILLTGYSLSHSLADILSIFIVIIRSFMGIFLSLIDSRLLTLIYPLSHLPCEYTYFYQHFIILILYLCQILVLYCKRNRNFVF